jgi:ribulose-5-phosphate 4-epimerase/fuculose-1-phosphate aldolase
MGPPDFPAPLRRAILRAARLASQNGLVPGNQGNFSARDPITGRIAITPHDRPYDLMAPADLVLIDADGGLVDVAATPSYDLAVHLALYRYRGDVHAVIHTEPPFVNAFGAVGLPVEPVTSTGLKSANGLLPVMGFRGRRDTEFAEEMIQLMGDRHGIVWGNHGLLVIGRSIEEALDRSIGIEFNAKVAAIAAALGKPRSLRYLDASMVLA